MADSFESRLADLLRREVTGFESLIGCRQLSTGASQETWCIEIQCDAAAQRLALRREQPTATPGAGVGGIAPGTEAQLFQLAGNNGVPGPEVVYVLRGEDQLGEGFIMQWLDGETLGQRIVYDDAFAEIRPRLAGECGRILGRIHGIDTERSDIARQLPCVTAAELVDDTWQRYRDLDTPVPMIDYTWRWLREHLPTDSRTRLVHGDFRNGNLMVTPQGINAVLDWELAHIGDPVRDLGWLCVNSWRFGKSELPVGGFGEIDDLLRGYRESSGSDVTPGELQFWQVFGSFWWAMATLQMANSWRSGETPSLERPVIGRRSSEAQMDCVNLLLPGSFTVPGERRALDDGTQLPMPAELLQGVRDFLKQQVAQQLAGHDRFLARVAANSIGIAQRELLYAEELQADEQFRLRALLGAGEAGLDNLRRQLVAALRSDMPLDAPGLAAHLRQTVAGQLFIDQPHYSALHGATQP